MTGRTRARLHSGSVARLANRVLGAEAFVIGRRIFLSRQAAAEIGCETARGRRILAHELTHVTQYARHGVARFLALYAADYVRSRLRGASHAAAYASIRFEREAERAAEAVEG